MLSRIERAVAVGIPIRRAVIEEAHPRQPSRRRRNRRRVRAELELGRRRRGWIDGPRHWRVRRRGAAAGAARRGGRCGRFHAPPVAMCSE
eukprot:scaffold12640_cov106-Isochrysis_galbana.AAC.5